MKRITERIVRALSERRVRTDGGVDQQRSTTRGWLENDLVRSAPFWGPPFLLMGFFVYAAIAWNFALSLTDYSGYAGTPDYFDPSLDNYRSMLADPYIWEATRNTFLLLVAFTVVCLFVGLVLALLLDREIRFGRTFRTIYLLPFSLSFIVTAQFWLWMYNVEDGLINQMIGVTGYQPNWLGDHRLVLGSVIFALVWQFSGYTMVIYLAALRTIPRDQYEAAEIDGASTIRMYRRVIIPQLRPAMVSASVVLVLFALKAFDFLYAIFDGYRPRRGADILATKMMRESFDKNEWAYGASIGIVLFVLSLAVIAPYLYNQYKRGNL